MRNPFRLLQHNLRTLVALGWLCLLSLPASAGNLLVLGDSISAAYGLSLEQGWVSLLGDELQSAGKPVNVVNASISGETTAGGLRRLPALLEEHQPAAVIIELGGNDGLRGYPIDKLRDNLRQMVTLAQQAGARVMLLPMEIPPNYGSRYTGMFRESYPAVTKETDSVLGPFLLESVATDPALMQSDGIHPTAEAQALLLDNVRAAIMELL